jgi:hypothetical protein
MDFQTGWQDVKDLQERLPVLFDVAQIFSNTSNEKQTDPLSSPVSSEDKSHENLLQAMPEAR